MSIAALRLLESGNAVVEQVRFDSHVAALKAGVAPRCEEVERAFHEPANSPSRELMSFARAFPYLCRELVRVADVRYRGDVATLWESVESQVQRWRNTEGEPGRGQVREWLDECLSVCKGMRYSADAALEAESSDLDVKMARYEARVRSGREDIVIADAFGIKQLPALTRQRIGPQLAV